MQRMNVVLPEPDGPMTHDHLARRTVSETPLSTWSRPNHFWTSVASTTIGLAARGAADGLEDVAADVHAGHQRRH